MAKPLGRVIRELREEAGISPAALARAAAMHPAALNNIESGARSQLRFATVCQIAAALNVSTDDIGVRAGLLRTKGTPKARPSGKPATVLAGVSALESLLSRAVRLLARLKKQLTSDS